LLKIEKVKKGNIIVDTSKLYKGTELKVLKTKSKLIIAEIIKSKLFAPSENYVATLTKDNFEGRFKRKIIKNSIKKIRGELNA